LARFRGLSNGIHSTLALSNLSLGAKHPAPESVFVTATAAAA
jgi:hypothetical protein